MNGCTECLGCLNHYCLSCDYGGTCKICNEDFCDLCFEDFVDCDDCDVGNMCIRCYDDHNAEEHEEEQAE